MEDSGASNFRHNFTSHIPLAEQMRPSDLTHYFGQEHVLGQDKVLRTLLEKRDIPSMILWGPPGCGKVLLNQV
jgi:putative ATPase